MSSSGKSKTAADEDWVGELLVNVVTLTSIGMFRFALRWPDIASLLTVFAVTGVLGGLHWTCVLTAACAAGVGVAAGLAGLVRAADRQAGRRLSAHVSGVSAALAHYLRTSRPDHFPARQTRHRPAGARLVLGAHRRGGRHLEAVLGSSWSSARPPTSTRVLPIRTVCWPRSTSR